MATSASSNNAVEVINNQTVSASGSYSANPIDVAGMSHVEVLCQCGVATGSPSLTVNAIVVDPNNSSVAVKTYSATALTTSNSVQTILLDTLTANNIIGDKLNITWTFSGSGNLANVYVRVIWKKV